MDDHASVFTGLWFESRRLAEVKVGKRILLVDPAQAMIVVEG